MSLFSLSPLQGKRNRLVGALQDAGWRPIVPEGGYFVCCNVSSLPFLDEFADVEITPALPKRVRPGWLSRRVMHARSL